MIVKVQRALHPAGAASLIYNQSKSVMRMQHLSKEDLKKMGDDMKAYFEAKNDTNKVILLKRIPDQDW